MSAYEVCIYWSQSQSGVIPALVFKANGQSNSGYSFELALYPGGYNMIARSFAGSNSWQQGFHPSCHPIGYTRQNVYFDSISLILDDAIEGEGLSAGQWARDSLNGLARAGIITQSQAQNGCSAISG